MSSQYSPDNIIRILKEANISEEMESKTTRYSGPGGAVREQPKFRVTLAGLVPLNESAKRLQKEDSDNG